MAAVGTQSVRKRLIDLLVEDVNSGSNTSKYFIGIGKSDTYNDTDTPIAPQAHLREEMLARANLQAVKQISDCTTVIARYNWSSGGIYSAFSDVLTGGANPANPFYVVTEENQVYICLQQGKDNNGITQTSTVKPNFNTAGVGYKEAFRTSDGYVWKFLYSISAVRSFAFQSAGFVPIQKVDWETAGDSTGLDAFELEQLGVQKAAIPGQILGVRINNPGSGYTGTPKVNFKGNGTGAKASITIVGGAIAKIEMQNESAALGSGYSYASAELIDSAGNGSGALITPILGPVSGIGADAKDDLSASSIMFTIKPDGDEAGSFITTNDFRQISVYRNLEQSDSDAVLYSSRGKALKYMKMKNSPASGLFTRDRLIRGVSSNAAAYIDDFDSANIFYHQNEKTGFGSFVDGEIIDESDGVGRGPIDSAPGSALIFSGVDAFSGECLYIENRAAVVRDNNQQEDIKVIITL
jgi:hypothetical protein